MPGESSINACTNPRVSSRAVLSSRSSRTRTCGPSPISSSVVTPGAPSSRSLITRSLSLERYQPRLVVHRHPFLERDDDSHDLLTVELERSAERLALARRFEADKPLRHHGLDQPLLAGQNADRVWRANVLGTEAQPGPRRAACSS